MCIRDSPQPPRQVAQLGIVLLATLHRHQRHAALRAGARADLDDLGMHRTRVTAAANFRLLLLTEVLAWIGLEGMNAVRRAEPVRLPLVLDAARRGGGLDRHAADGIDDHWAKPACLFDDQQR